RRRDERLLDRHGRRDDQQDGEVTRDAARSRALRSDTMGPRHPWGRMATVELSSSLRTTPLAVTLARARARARALGITRVTDVTRLDRVGVPVYASIRPTAAPGSLCVNAGKGLHAQEAEVGAYMEAIEFALAEPGASGVGGVGGVKVIRATARD